MPLINEVRFDPVLTNISVGYEPEGYIADDVMPNVPVKLEDGSYWVWGDERFSTVDALRAPRARYRAVDFGATRQSYHAEEYGLEFKVDDRERNNSALPGELEEEGTEIITANLKNAKEKRVANLVLSTTNITQNTTLAGATQWSDVAGGDPIGVGATAAATIQGTTGKLPNSVAMGYKVWNKLQTNPKIQALLAEGEQLALQRLARLWNVQNIYVGTVLTSTNKKGQATVLGDVWGKDVLFFHKVDRASRRRPSLGYQFRVQDFKTFRYRRNEITSDVVRVNHIVAEKIVAAKLAYLVKAAIA